MSSNYEKVETTKTTLLFGNLFVAVWMLIGAAGCWLVNPLLGWLFLGFAAFSLYIIIRRLLCNSCYYCKSCTKGLAKLSIFVQGANYIPGQSKASVLGMTAFVYVVLLAVPGVVLANSVIQGYNPLTLLSLAGVLAFGLFAVALRFRNRNRALWKLADK